MIQELKIKLVYKGKRTAKKVEQEFSATHAQRLLQIQKEKGFDDWGLPPDSGYKFENDNIILMWEK